MEAGVSRMPSRLSITIKSCSAFIILYTPKGQLLTNNLQMLWLIIKFNFCPYGSVLFSFCFRCRLVPGARARSAEAEEKSWSDDELNGKMTESKKKA